MSQLSLRGVTRYFGGVRALNDVTLDVEPGARHVIFGPNGAGKTTLFRVISGEVAPTRCKVFLDGQDITHLPAWQRIRLGLGRTFQVTSLFPELTVTENAMLAAQAFDRSRFSFWTRRSRSDAVLEAVTDLLDGRGLGDRMDDVVAQLPYGQQRILEIVLALAGRPSVLLLDEPTAGVPTADAEEVMDHVRDLPDDITIVLIEHDLDLAFRFSRTATAMADGAIIAEGTTDEIRANEQVQELYLGTETSGD